MVPRPGNNKTRDRERKRNQKHQPNQAIYSQTYGRAVRNNAGAPG